MSKYRHLRADGALSPDHRKKWSAPMPTSRMPPFVLACGFLFTSFQKQPAGLSQEQCRMIEQVVSHLRQADPCPDGWLDPFSLEVTPFSFPGWWLRRRAADYVTIRLADCVAA